jgi:hypothetical protein
MSRIATRAAFGCACALLPFGCAHLVDTPFDETDGGTTNPVTTGAGGGSTVGAGGNTGATTGGGQAGTNGGATTTGGSGGAAGATVGAGGNGGTTAGGGNGGAGGSAGSGGGAGRGGNAGSGGGGGAGVDAGPMLRPTGVRLGTSTASPQQAPSTGGTAFTQSCAANEVIIGYRGTVDVPDAAVNYLRNFRAICATLSVTATTPYQVRTTQAETLAAIGSLVGSIMQTASCPANQVVVGFTGRSGRLIDALSFVCAPLVIAGTSPTFTLAIGGTSVTGAIGGPGGAPFAQMNCPAGRVAVGDAGRQSTDINAFNLLCAMPTLVVQ